MILTIIFAVFAVLLVAFAAQAVAAKNLVHSVVWLMLFLFTMGVTFIVLGTDLVGSIELLVYVGAIVTLLAFTLMLTGGKEVE